jgi:hypothetical protein
MRNLRATEAHRRTGRLLRWVLAVTLGEAIGFMVPVVVGAGMAAGSWGPLPILIAMVLAGAVEGAVLGAHKLIVCTAGECCRYDAGGSQPPVWERLSHGRLGCCRARSVI